MKRILGLSRNLEEGADIVAERYDGKLDIVQCKYLDNPDRNLTKKHIQDALEIAEGHEAKKHVDTVLMCSNAKGLTRNTDLRKRHPNIQIRIVPGSDFRQLSPEDFANIRRVIEDSIPKYGKKEPRGHQSKAVEAVTKHFRSESRGQLVHACGTGKTLTSYFIYRKFKPDLALFAVPSLQLINQTLTEWSKESLADGNAVSPFVVCSDKSNEKIGEMEPELWLEELGIKVSNGKEELAKFLRSQRTRKVIFTTYQSGPVLAKNLSEIGQKIDLGFFDEAHNTVGSKSKPNAHLLFDENIMIDKRVFMTATPKKLVGRSDTLLSMNDSEVYGQVIDEITVKDAIEGIDGLKLLNDYLIVTQLVNGELYRELLTENPFVIDHKKLDQETEMKLLAASLTLKKVRKDKKVRHAVSFHHRRERARAFRQGVAHLDPELKTFYVDGKQSGADRSSILEEFSLHSPSLVSNARCLSEGVNVPSIDAVMFVDPKQSRIDITQAIGRALRKGSEDKGLSYIIVPVNVDESAPEAIDEAYQQILMVLRSMSEHDGRIVEYFRLVREGKKPPKNFIEISEDGLSELIDLEDFERQLHFKAWDRVAKLGRRPFEQAREFARSLRLEGYSQWLAYMRSDSAPADIPVYPDHTYIEWTDWRDFLGNPSLEDDFDELLREYKAFAQGKQIPFPRDREVTESGFTLGNKVKGILRGYKENFLPAYKVERVQKELIDPGLFSWEGRDDWVWRQKLAAYAEQKAKNVNFKPKKRERFNGWILETWERQQKLRYRVLNGESISQKLAPLKPWQLKELQKINFEFEPRRERIWYEMFEYWKEISEKYGSKIPKVDPVTKKPFELNGSKIQRWVSKQRSKFKDGALEQWKIDLLEREPNWSWNPHGDVFSRNVRALESLKADTGSANPTQKTLYKGVAVGVFATQVRDKYRRGKLSDEQIQKLKSIGFKFAL